MNFRLDDYEPVADRLARFWAEHPTGRITTSLAHVGDASVIVAAQAYRTATDTAPAATGLAEETRTDRGVNATSYVENAETSAIGRALANLGYAPKGATARPSREEMTKASRGRPANPAPNPATPVPRTPVAAVIEQARKAGYEGDALAADVAERTGGVALAVCTDGQLRVLWVAYRDLAKERAAGAEQTVLQDAAEAGAGCG